MKRKDKKKNKEDKNIITIDRKVWNNMNYNRFVCNHSLINYYTKQCANCKKSIEDIEKEKEEKNGK